METKVGIVIPVRNCLELTQDAIASIRTRHAFRVYVIDDHSDAPMKDWLRERRDIVSFTDSATSGVAANWNLGIAAAIDGGCTHFLVANNDILFHPTAIDRMVNRIDRGDVALVSADDKSARSAVPQDIFRYVIDDLREIERPDFACFMITERVILEVGWFDENYRGAYYEDNDYEAQIVMSGNRALSLHDAPYYHYGCRTISENPVLAPEIQRNADDNARYFVRKWGRVPINDPVRMRSEYYPRPFEPSLADSGADHAEIETNGLSDRT